MNNSNTFILIIGLGLTGIVLAAGLFIRNGAASEERKGSYENNQKDVLKGGEQINMKKGRKVYGVDLDNSLITWHGRKLVGANHTGTVRFSAGELSFEDGELLSGEMVVDMTSIVNSDLSGANKEKLEGHLKSADFFSVEKFPMAKLVIKTIEQNKKIKADLTIKGITKEIFLPIEVNVQESGYLINTKLVFNRADFDIRFGSGRFFDNLGDGLIEDEVKVDVKAVLQERK